MQPVVAGVDLGGTKIAAALGDAAGNLVAQRQIATESHGGPDHVIGRIARLIQQLQQASGQSCQALGVGVPGLVDTARGVTRFLPNLPTQWRDVALGPRLAAELGCPVRLLNDVRTATLAELRFGHGQDRPDISLAFFALGTGVGGGIVLNGQLRLGPLGAAGELGHQSVAPQGLLCGCGNVGCLETVASGPAIAAEGIRLVRSGLAPSLFQQVEGDVSRITPSEMCAAAENGDHYVRDALRRAAEYVGVAAANVVVVLHPDMIVLGGGVAEIGELLTDTVRQVIRQRVGMFPVDDILVKQSCLREQAGVLGAIALAADGV